MVECSVLASEIGEAFKWGIAGSVAAGMLAAGIVRIAADVLDHMRCHRRWLRRERHKAAKFWAVRGG